MKKKRTTDARHLQSKERQDHRLDSQVVFRLILLVNQIAKPFLDRYAVQYNLSLTEWRVMMALAANPGVCGEDVARFLSMERMTVSRVLRRMQSDGRTERRQSPNDRKRSCWFLTSDAWEIFDDIVPHALERQEQVLRGLTKAQRKTFSSAIDSVLDTARSD